MVQSAEFESALALSRFGLGARAAGTQAVTGDIRGRLHDEIRRGAPPVTGEEPLPSTPELLAELLDLVKLERRQRKAPPPAAGAEAAETRNPNPTSEHFNAEIDARYNGNYADATVGFNERMVMFWTNHFAIATSKSRAVRITSGAYEREAIRPNIFGRFTDLVLAVETHPCMLNFLDNATSIGPESRAALKSGRGLNENLAREIMELHILGVNSGYSQADVTNFAKALTGWTVNHRQNDPDIPYGDFMFAPGNHQPGNQVILGKAYHNAGFFQAADILTDLCQRPAAAHFIATKLATHFVADTPPPSLVDRLADTFRATGGDLAEVSHVLIESDEAWTPEAVKIRSPQEWLIATLRGTGLTPSPSRVSKTLSMMGQPLWNPSGPNGFSDQFAAWATPEGLTARMNVASDIAAEAPEDTDPRDFAERLLGPRLSDSTRAAIAHAESGPQGVSLVFLSPEFLRR